MGLKITNANDLPLPVAEVIMAKLALDWQRAADRYEVPVWDDADHHFSVTELLSPPFQRQLFHRILQSEDQDIVLDAAGGYWSIFGTVTHAVLERYALKDLEHRLTEVKARINIHVGGMKIGVHCTSDLLTFDGRGKDDPSLRCGLWDYKVASIWEYILGERPERKEQLLFNAFITDCSHPSIPNVTHVANVYLFRDWQKSEAGRRHDYPQQPIMVKPYPMEPAEAVYARLKQRVEQHLDPNPPLCTPEERWQAPTTYALRKVANKTAKRVLRSMHEVKEYAVKEKIIEHPDDPLPTEWTVDVRPGSDRRCVPDHNGVAYCPVARFCPHGAQFFND